MNGERNSCSLPIRDCTISSLIRSSACHADRLQPGHAGDPESRDLVKLIVPYEPGLYE